MVELDIKDRTLHLEVKGWDKLWAFKSRLEIPLEHVRGADTHAEEARLIFKGLKAPGTHLPGIISAGSFYNQGKWVFYDVHDADKAIVIHLLDERYDRLVIEVADPRGAVARIEEALSRAS
jgi:hypothetical protein